MLEKEYFVDALVDSGNFAVDPIDMSPIMIITFAFAKKIFPHGVPDIYGADSVEEKIKKRIPITFQIPKLIQLTNGYRKLPKSCR